MILDAILFLMLAITAPDTAGNHVMPGTYSGFANIPAIGKSETDDILDELDYTVKRREQFNRKKERRIAGLKNGMDGASPEDMANICSQLFEEYKYYQYDSAYSYARRLEALASNAEGGGNFYVNSAKARSALLFCFKSVGFFKEAVDIIEDFDPEGVPDDLLVRFYILSAETWQNLSSYVSGSYDLQEEYDRRKIRCYNLALSHADAHSYEHALMSLELRLLEDYSDSLAIIGRRSLISRFDLDEHEQAVQYSILSSAFGNMPGYEREALYYRAVSTICDIRSGTHETTSAKVLAEYMYSHGNIQRAYRYIHLALRDAEFYGSRLRMVEINSILPVIENSRLRWMNSQRVLSMIFGSVVLLLLLITSTLLLKLRRKKRKLSEIYHRLVENSNMLKKTTESLAELNRKLKEANEIKDEYIIQSLYGNSSFVNIIEEQTAFASRKIMAKQYGDALAMLHNLGIKKERERMFTSFDSAFLKLFPNFIEEFNRMFPENARIRLDENGRLPMEVRIFALMRLGIDNAAQVAEYLNLSVNTVYVYKAKTKSKAIVPKEDFDSMVMAIPKP